jgi:hypothetical protein
VWGRSGWTGAQRTPVQWGGDPQSDWEGLAASIRGGLSWGMSGVPCYSTDIGGFYGDQPSKALYLRWVEAGVFCSHFRVHGIGAREPWQFGTDAEAIARRWFEFRYRLIPYIMGLVAEAAATGLPVMRAMPLAFPEDRAARGFDGQYMFGPALLVAPVVRADNRVDIWLPEGTWHDLWNDDSLGRRPRDNRGSAARLDPGVRPRRASPAARAGGAAHRRDRSGGADQRAMGLRPAAARAAIQRPAMALRSDGTGAALTAPAHVTVRGWGTATHARSGGTVTFRAG